MSMVDTVLFHHLLRAVPAPCQVVLIGDADQLPSVGPGNVLGDVVRSGRVETVRLTEVFRQAQQSRIVVNAHRVNQGELPLWSSSPDSDFFFIEKETPDEILATVEDLVARRLPAAYKLDPKQDIQVLTPMHRGTLGAANLNAELQELLTPGPVAATRGGRSFRIGDKVMQIRNNYDLDVFNGDIGEVCSADPIERKLVARFDSRDVEYDTRDLDELVLAYACSIHKAQGSEFPVVVLPLHTQHYVMLQRNLLYTALTRGKRLVVVVGTRRALAIAVKNNETEKRMTRLASRLAEGSRAGC
jgi:exodeoxyribonuclease V alpha subunit